MKKKIDNYILSWIENNIESERKITDLVSETGFCRKTIETWFKRENGMSLGSYLYSRRMTRISVLLRYTSIPVTEIAELFHYSSTQNFSRAFTKYTGKTPTRYRYDKIWDCSTLQCSLIKKGKYEPPIKYCSLPDMYIKGETKKIKEHLQNSIEVLNTCFSTVEEILTAGISEVYMTCRTDKCATLFDSRNRNIVAILTVGVLSDAAQKESVIVPGGDYIYYEFSGDWNDYVYYTRFYHIKLMAENNIIFEERQYITTFKRNISINGYDFTVYIPVVVTKIQSL
ncbi:helix-turn-helix transcriptional regulator [Salmonella enterica subsp. enterica]|nr:AraC family transcriptional regulator [Salmonella enterica]EEC4901409.1 helix-turn-helix transcriptional regulator [Salmonella enterica subsp. enterica serovar Kampala]HCB4520261.1 helix-turn-helix transcriptional regulator [Salmonella enterica]